MNGNRVVNSVLVALIDHANELRGARAPSNGLLTDEELAYRLQSEMYADFRRSEEDYRFALSLDRALRSDNALLEVLSVIEMGERDDREAALALSRGLPIQPPSRSQRALENLILPPPISLYLGSRRPRYVRDLMWADDELPRTTVALATETETRVPQPPSNELSNSTALETIRRYPRLFEIVTPINFSHFENYLVNHPNPAFVQSVCKALRDGFWPWAETEDPDLPLTWDNSRRPLRDPAHAQFVKEQRDTEIELGQFSPSFGPDLLPGMYSMPIGVTTKPHSDKLRLVVDQSMEPHSLNSMIPKKECSVHLDGMWNLGRTLRRVHVQHPGRRIVLWKSDVSRAYRLMPMHPLWQIRQVVTIDGQRHVDRCNNFGNRAGGKVWGSFAGLVVWIATFVKSIEDLFAYVDDFFSWDFEENMQWYGRYKNYFPAKQTRLLELWDELGIPHEEKKQLWGSPLDIIGFEVDPNKMTITMPLQSRSELVEDIRAFAVVGHSHPLHEVQALAGWINWALNVYPVLRPGLSMMYSKMSGTMKSRDLISVDVIMRRELLWLARWIEPSSGISINNSVEWGQEEADQILLADACPTGMGFWVPQMNTGFQCRLSEDPPRSISYFEALAVVSALEYTVYHIHPRPRLVAIHTDNTNAFHMFNTLHAKPEYNPLLLTAIELSLKFDVSFRVLHIAGEDNVVADALSRFKNNVALTEVPGLQISEFQLPQLVYG